MEDYIVKYSEYIFPISGEILLHHYDFTGDFAGDGNWLESFGNHPMAELVRLESAGSESNGSLAVFSVGQDDFFRTDLDG